MKNTFVKIGSKIKHFGKELFAFLSSKIFLKNFAGVLGMLLLLFFMTTTWLKCYTDHGEALHMHNYVGMNLLDVKDLAKQKGFAISVDSTAEDGVLPLTVTKQHPKPDHLVKEGRTVYLTVQKKGIDLITLPYMATEFNSLRKSLTALGFLISKKTEVDSRVAEETILDAIYEGKDGSKSIFDDWTEGKEEIKLPRGSKITLVVSEKGYSNTTVPDLICKTTSEAQMILKDRNLTENIIRDQTVVDKGNAYVWFQDPAAGSVIRFGEQVKIRITQMQPESCEDNELEAPREDQTSGEDSSEEENGDDENEEFN